MTLTTFLQDREDRRADEGLRIKRAKIRRVFQREQQLISGSLSHTVTTVCDHPGRCALGALLAASGVSDDELSVFGQPIPEWFELLEHDYGITDTEAMALLDANDGSYKDLWESCGYNYKRYDPANDRDAVRGCVVNAALDCIIDKSLPTA